METERLTLSPPPRGEVEAFERSENGSGGGNAGRVVTIARTWIGTPYLHQASVKGAGADCLGLLRGVWRELYGTEPEIVPPYSPDWAEAAGDEVLHHALSRHLREIPRDALAPGDVALFRMVRRGPAKHCGIIALKQRSGSAYKDSLALEKGGQRSLIHARQNRAVSEEPFSRFWHAKLAFAFRIARG
jgi:NlpC/P60 family putative phage cell wall peptidase